MSEPMTANEIEDVLSSIRRLVSEDLRPVVRAASPAAPGDKLILTPALRVVEGGDPGDHSPLQPTDPVEGEALHAPLTSELAVVLDGIARNQGMFDAPLAMAFGDAQGAALDPAPAAPVPEPEPVPLPTIEAVVAAVGAAVTDQRAMAEGAEPAEIESDWVPDGWSDSSPAAPEQEDATMEVEVPVSTPQDVVATAPSAPADDPGADWTDNDAAPWAGFVSARDPVSAPDDAAAKLRDDQAEAEAVAEITGGGFAQVEAAQVEAGEPDAGAGGFTGLFDAEDAVLDEEILRDLVRDIIREELQGGLGQRITRNVRKLVRAEINLALAGRDFT